MVEKILLAKPRGFCAGVERAISILNRSIEKYETPIYVKHQIVHNTHIIENFKKKGIKFIEDLNEVPNGSVLILSAHGSAPNIIEQANKNELIVIDSVCPFVQKLHLQAKDYHKQGYDIILIGKRGHQEVIGTMGYAKMNLISNISDIDKLNISNNKIVYLTQTTLSIDQTKEMVDKLKLRFPQIIPPLKEDICYATTNRQMAAKEIAKRADLVLVVGSNTSSNSNSLRDVASSYANAYLINDKSELNIKWLENIKTLGITSGASVPEELVQDLINEITSIFGNVAIETIEIAKEEISIKLSEKLDDGQVICLKHKY